MVYGYGVYEEGKYRAKVNGEHTPEYRAWSSMMRRCYDKAFLVKWPTYQGCSVAEEWRKFQDFAEWYNTQAGAGDTSFHVDKDILIKGNKVYSSDTAVLIPARLNTLLNNNKAKRGNLPIGVTAINKGGFSARVHSATEDKRIYLGFFKTPEEAFQAYVKGKQEQVKVAAEFYKDIIDERTYQALMTYQVEITD